LSDATLAAVQGGERKVETAEQMLSSSQGRFIYCENFEFDMASSQIRKKLARGEDVTAELDTAVIEYINENNLYQD
jgi:nicotinic acid mononucleotide adenylyltransferase